MEKTVLTAMSLRRAIAVFLILIILFSGVGFALHALWKQGVVFAHCRPPRGYIARYLSVSELPAQMNSENITIAYYISPQLNPDRQTVFYINGGPGIASAGQGDRILEPYFHDSRYHQFVFFDQRGTGCSTSFPDNIPDLEMWGARGISNDLATLVATLQIEAKNVVVWGHSYGSLVIPHFVEDHLRGPERLISTGYSIVDDVDDWLFDRQFQQVEHFTNNLDEVELRGIELLRRSLANSCLEYRNQRICGGAMADALYRIAPDRTAFSKIIYRAMRGDLDPIRNLVRSALATVPQEALGYMDYTPGRIFSEECRTLFKRGRLAGFDHVPILECRFDAETVPAAISESFNGLRPDPISWSRVDQLLTIKGNSGLQMLVGRQDYFAPRKAAERSQSLGFDRIIIQLTDAHHFNYSIEKFLDGPL